jgi:hypothetical protein
MSWEQRLHEMALAGGALAVAACTSSAGPSGPSFCCNADPDPCCAQRYCGATMTPECSADGGGSGSSSGAPVDSGSGAESGTSSGAASGSTLGSSGSMSGSESG